MIFCRKLLVFIFIFLLALLNYVGTSTSFPGETTRAQSNIAANASRGGGTHYIFNDWVIENGDNVVRANETIVLSGNLFIENGGSLTLSNVTLKLDSNFDGENQVNIKEGGRLEVTDSDISSNSTDRFYKFFVSGSTTIMNSSISYVWGDLNDPWHGGIQILTDSVTLRNDTIFNCKSDGIQCWDSAPLIVNSTIHSNGEFGIWCNSSANPKIVDNKIFNNRYGIVCDFGSSPLIDNNTIFNNIISGINCELRSNPVIKSNIIYGCSKGISCFAGAEPTIENNSIYSNNCGIACYDISRPYIIGNNIFSNYEVGILVNNSSPKIYENTISLNGEDGMRISKNSSPAIRRNEFRQNGDEGIQCTDSNFQVTDCVFDSNRGDSIYIKYDCEITLENCQILNSEMYDIHLKKNSTLISINSTFEKDNICLEDKISKIVVKWHLELLILDENSKPLKGATISISNGTCVNYYTTGHDGLLYNVTYEEYTQNDNNGDHDGSDPGEIVNVSLKIINVSKEGYNPYSKTFIITKDNFIVITLEKKNPLYVCSIFPENGSTEVSVFTNVVVVFDRNVNEDSLVLNVRDQDNNSISYGIEYNPINFTMNITFSDSLTGDTTYWVEVVSVADYDEIGMDQPFVSYFTTESIVIPDHDEDGIPDISDPDDDNDGYSDTIETDEGTDPLDNASTPADLDNDLIPDSIDPDDDNDDYPDDVDQFPHDPFEWNDTDSDGIGDNIDTDDDGDGYPDNLDIFPRDPFEWNDADSDGIGDNMDTDDDNDNYPDVTDQFPYDPFEWNDTDSDGIGDNTDTDDDNDGYNDTIELLEGTSPLNNKSIPMDYDYDFIPDSMDDDIDGDDHPNDEDDYPYDPRRWKEKRNQRKNAGNSSIYIWVGIIFLVFVASIIGIFIKYFRKQKENGQKDEDELGRIAYENQHIIEEEGDDTERKNI